MTSAVQVAKFAARVVDTGGKFATSVVDTCDKFAAGVIDTCDKFAGSVIDTGSAPWLANITVIFWKDLKLPWYFIFTGLRDEDDSWKKPEAKNLVTLSL
jgi:hypothetical protein